MKTLEAHCSICFHFLVDMSIFQIKSWKGRSRCLSHPTPFVHNSLVLLKDEFLGLLLGTPSQGQMGVRSWDGLLTHPSPQEERPVIPLSSQGNNQLIYNLCPSQGMWALGTVTPSLVLHPIPTVKDSIITQ